MSAQNKREKILHVFTKNPTWSHSKIAAEAGVHKNTAQQVIKRFRESGTIDRKPGSGRKVGSGDKIRERQIVSAIKQNPCLSLRDLGRKYGTDHKNVSKILEKHGYKTHKKVEIANRDTLKSK